jgi:RNA polymerase sigma factor (sigma-70 family)
MNAPQTTAEHSTFSPAAIGDELDARSDSELIEAVRGGSDTVYGTLYARYVGNARGYARSLTRRTADADDIVSEAFTKMLVTLRDGKGPNDRLLPYLLGMIRNLAHDGHRHEQRVEVTDDVEQEAAAGPDVAVLDLFDQSAAARAFRALPDAWKHVLWQTEVLQEAPRDIADGLDTTPHNVAAMASRAREGLRSAFLSECLAPPNGVCGEVAHRLGAYVRGSVRQRECERIETHLIHCERCNVTLDDIYEINGTISQTGTDRSHTHREPIAI